MKRFASFGITTLLLFAAACADEAPRTEAQGNQALGIASFKTDETPTTTTVIGLDAQGHEVGRVALTHGTFTLSPAYREDYDTDQIDGRKLEATLGENHYLFEREGYEPLMHMPAFPASEAELATLLADSHVQPILESWQLGFDSSATDVIDELAYGSYQKAGSLVHNCNGSTSCGTLTRTGTNAGTYSIGTCGGTTPASTAQRIAITGYSVDEVAQCCPSGAGGYAYDWWARKQCPKSGLATENCGTVTAGKACVGCGVFNANYACTVSYSTGTAYSYYQALCQPACNYSTDCGQPDGCGGTCTSYKYPQRSICN